MQGVCLPLVNYVAPIDTCGRDDVLSALLIPMTTRINMVEFLTLSHSGECQGHLSSLSAPIGTPPDQGFAMQRHRMAHNPAGKPRR